MRIRPWFNVACGVALVANSIVTAAQAGAPDVVIEREGLVKVNSKVFDDVRVRPGTDFRGYTKVMLDPTQVAFANGWMKEFNPPRVDFTRRTTVEDAEEIAQEARTGFGEILASAFRSAGYEVVAAPAAEVLALSPRVIDMYVNAPESVTTSLRTRVYTTEAGEATLALDVRDSMTGLLLGRIVDRRIAGDRSGFRPSFTSTVSNRFYFERLFDAWAGSCVEGLDALKARSPVVVAAPTQKP